MGDYLSMEKGGNLVADGVTIDRTAAGALDGVVPGMLAVLGVLAGAQ